MIEDSSRFYVRFNSDSDKLINIETELQTIEEKGESLQHPLKRGQIIAARYEEDDKWYRAKIEEVNKGDNISYEVFFMDYGNYETVEQNNTLKLPTQLLEYPGLVYLSKLAYLKVPRNEQPYTKECEDEIRNKAY